MSNRLFDKGRQGFLDGSLDWDTNTFKVALFSDTGNTAAKAITGITNASPMTVTSASHGFSTGDIVVIHGVVGTTAANGTWKIANSTTNTFDLTTVKDGLNSTGNGVYSSGGMAIDLTLATNRSDINTGNVGTDQTIASPTVTNGVAGCANPTWTALSGSVCTAAYVYKSTGTASTDRLAHWIDGKTQVVVAADAASSDTTLWVEPLEGIIPNGSTMIFSNGVTATASSQAAAGARSISVSALANAISAGHTADVATLSAGIPLTPGGGDVTLAIDTGANHLFKL